MKWFLHDSGYIKTLINGKEKEHSFKNVCITDNSDWNKSEMFIWFRVDKQTETLDLTKANLIANAPKNMLALDLIKGEVKKLQIPDETLQKYWGAGYLVAIEKVLEIIKKAENETLGN